MGLQCNITLDPCGPTKPSSGSLSATFSHCQIYLQPSQKAIFDTMDEALTSSADIGWRLKIFTAFFIPLQILAVALRFYARWLVIGTNFALDDGIVLVTLGFQLTLSVVGVGEFV